jgi:hypothetical protein
MLQIFSGDQPINVELKTTVSETVSAPIIAVNMKMTNFTDIYISAIPVHVLLFWLGVLPQVGVKLSGHPPTSCSVPCFLT